MLATLMIGFGLGCYVHNLRSSKARSIAPNYEAAKSEIAKLYKDRLVEGCRQARSDSSQGADKYELNYRYLRFNKTADRAILSDCGDYDRLLARKSTGEWEATTVNLTIHNRVNPVWQKECHIEDITVADDVVRQENDFIDEMNFKECKRLNTL